MHASESAQAVVTKHQGLGAHKGRMLLPPSSGGWKQKLYPRSRCWQRGCPVMTHLLVPRLPSSQCCPHMTAGRGGSVGSLSPGHQSRSRELGFCDLASSPKPHPPLSYWG